MLTERRFGRIWIATLQNETVRARPTTPLGQVRLWARRNPIRATRISLAAAALLGLLVRRGLAGEAG